MAQMPGGGTSGFGLGGKPSAAGAQGPAGKQAPNRQIYLNGKPWMPGPTEPGGDKRNVLPGGVPDYRTNGWDQVGVPENSSLVINVGNGQRMTVPYSPKNTHSELERQMQSRNLVEKQRALVKLGVLSASDFKSPLDWGNPLHEATREALLKAMEVGNVTGMSWEEVVRGKGLTDKQLSLARGAGSPSASGGGGSGASAGPVTTTSSIVQTSTRMDARALLRATMEQALGRAPSKEEIGDFLRQLNRKEENNPTVTTTTTSGDGLAVSQRSDPGINRDEFAQSYVKGQFADEASEFEGDNYEQMIYDIIGGL